MQLFGYNLSIEKKNTDLSGFGQFISSAMFEEKPMNFNTYYDMYSRNADVKSCVNEIQKTAGKSGYKLLQLTGKETDGTPKYKDISYSPFIRFFLNSSAGVKQNVDDWGAFNRLKKEYIKHLKISGNLFLLKIRNDGGKMISTKIIDSRNVSIVTDPSLKVLYYIVKVGATIFTVYPDNMFHFINTTDVKDEVYGGSEFSGIIYEVYSDNEAAISNYFAMLNNSVPAGLYILKDGVQQTDAKAILDEVKKAVTGSKNRNKSIVSNAIQDFKAMTQTHKDMDFVAMRSFNSEKICSALGVPRVVLNYTEGVQVGNGETQYKKYIENTIRPMEMELNYIFTTVLSEILPDVWFECIDNHINDKIEKVNIAKEMVKTGLWNRNEAREYTGDTTVNDELMNAYTVDSTTKLISDLEFSLADTVTPPTV